MHSIKDPGEHGQCESVVTQSEQLCDFYSIPLHPENLCLLTTEFDQFTFTNITDIVGFLSTISICTSF